jgi:subtilase family serine protease
MLLLRRGELVLICILVSIGSSLNVYAAYHFAQYKGRPPIHALGGKSDAPHGLTPAQIKKAYNLPASGGSGTIAIIGAYNDATIEQDLAVFSKTFGLPECTTKNGCFEKHMIDPKTSANSGWKLETSLDVEWAHAIAPNAKILLVSAKTPSGANLLSAIDYARNRADVVAVSMSFGGGEFPEEVSLDDHFTSSHPITFFASSGDNGSGVSWPASSPNVVSVGGTVLTLSNDGSVTSELAWSGSGGGISKYEKEPDYQKEYTIARSGGMRAVPDVSYNADPQSGVSVYASSGKKGYWYVLGGTSAGAPQWAAIKALSLSADNQKFYTDKSSDTNGNYFRDVKSGTNGDCGYMCTARKRYDYVTGLGSPLTSSF